MQACPRCKESRKDSWFMTHYIGKSRTKVKDTYCKMCDWFMRDKLGVYCDCGQFLEFYKENTNRISCWRCSMKVPEVIQRAVRLKGESLPPRGLLQ